MFLRKMSSFFNVASPGASMCNQYSGKNILATQPSTKIWKSFLFDGSAFFVFGSATKPLRSHDCRCLAIADLLNMDLQKKHFPTDLGLGIILLRTWLSWLYAIRLHLHIGTVPRA